MANEQLQLGVPLGVRSLSWLCTYTALGRLNLSVSVRLWGASEYLRKSIVDGAPLTDAELFDVLEAMTTSALRDARGREAARAYRT